MLKLARWLLLAAFACAPIAYAQTTSEDRLEGITTSVAVKPPVKAVSTVNLTLEGEQTVGGVAVVTGDRVLVKNQTAPAENGIYNVDTSEWERAADFDGALDVVKGTLVVSNASSSLYYRVTSADPITIGSSSITFEEVSGAVSATSIGTLLYGVSSAELAAGVTISDISKPYGYVTRYGAVCNDSANDTVAVQAALNVVAENDLEVVVPAMCLVDALKFDASNFTIRGLSRGAGLHASANITAGCAILNSLAGGADTSTNQSLLDSACGPGVITVRTNVANSLENVTIRDLTFKSNTAAIRGIWTTGFTRGSKIESSYFENFDGDAIALNGSWSFSLINLHIQGDGTNGTGLSLGRTGNGTRGGASVVNAPTIIGVEVTGHANCAIWNFGAGGAVTSSTFEGCVTDGFSSQSVDGVTFSGNYLEANGGDNFQCGGTNGTDFCTGWNIAGNHFNAATGNNIRLNGVQSSRIGPNNFSGAVTQQYFIAPGIGQYVLDNDIWVPTFSSTLISNFAAEANGAYNNFHSGNNKKYMNTQNGNYTFTIQDPVRITYKSSGGAGETWTIDANATVPMPVGVVIEGVNNGGGDLTLAITSDTLTGSTTVSTGTHFRLTKIATTAWIRQ